MRLEKTMGRVCIKDHRPEHSLGNDKWLNGCAQCEIELLEQETAYYRRRELALEQWQSRMRDPERTVVCDILANVFTLDPPIPGVHKTLVFGSTGGGTMYVKTANNETIVSTLGSSFTTLKSTVGNGGTVVLQGVTTAIWAWTGAASTVIAAATTTT
jgi:hypothetical protein